LLIAIDAGGRIYLGKDSYTDAATFRTMYPAVEDWLKTKAKYDPHAFSRRILDGE
jgi:decaprenylphospho-beta-D-ribofuranose 2-oxidase